MATASEQALEQARAAARVAREAAGAAEAYVDQAAAALGAAAHGATGGAVDPTVFRLAIFVLAIVVGALLAVGVPLTVSGTGLARAFGFLALVLASVNIFGGFLVTQRMLSMYRKKV